MTRYLISAFIVICSFTVSAQKNQYSPPDYKKISKAINREKSASSYYKLMARYKASDTTLSPEEYHLLYFGFSLQPGFSPDTKLPIADSLMKILHQNQIKADQYILVKKYAEAILEKNPFDMRYLDPLIYINRMDGNNNLADKLEFKLGRIIETIFTSGDGLTEQTAFHVIASSHEYDLLRALGFGFSADQRISNGRIDFLKVETNDYGIDGMYFNISAKHNSVKE